MKKPLLLLLLLLASPSLRGAETLDQAAGPHKAFNGKIATRRVIIGIRGGLNFNGMGPDLKQMWDSPGLQKKGHTGWNIGLVFDCPILESLYFQAGVFYKTKGFRMYEENHAYRRQISGGGTYLEFPLLFSYRYTVKPGMQVEFNLGPYIACAVGGNVKDIIYSYLLPPDPDPDPDDPELPGQDFNPGSVGTEQPKVKERKFVGDNLESSFGMRQMDYGVSFGTGITINRFYFGLQYDLGLTNLRNDVCWREDLTLKNRSLAILIGFNLFR